MLKPTLLGIISIAVLDSLGSITSREFNYDYTSLVYISYLIYGMTGVLVYRSTSKLFISFLAGLILGLFDSTIGWWISDVLEANFARMAIDNITRFSIILYVTISTGIVSLIAGWLSRFFLKRE